MIHLDPELVIHEDTKLTDPRYLRIHRARFGVGKPRAEGMIPTATREYIMSRSAVAGIVYCPSEEQVLMLRQFRFPIYRHTRDVHLAWIYETVAGLIDDGDTPEQTFVREVEEEAGVKIGEDQVKLHTSYFVSPGFVNEQHFILSAEIDSLQDTDPDAGLDEEGEAIVAEWQSYDEIRALVAGVKDDRGRLHKIVDGKTLMGLMKIGLA
jgi:GDP-mannose pyrophosphatase NudK